LSKHKKSVEARFKQVKLLLENALSDNKIQSHLDDFGYTSEKMLEGKLLFNKAYELYKRNFIAYNLDNPDEFQSLWNKAFQYYSQLIDIARLALQNERNAFIQLGLSGPRRTSLSGWLSQANQFYINALSNPIICKKLAEYGITEDKLETGKKQLGTVELAIVFRNTDNGDIRKLSIEYDKAFDRMEGWIHRFNIVSRIIFENKPQLLDKLQINHR
jgi:hypothetical protein